MIYDKPIAVCRLPDGIGSITQTNTLTPVFLAYCGELEVYHRRYWEAMQVDSRIDCMVEIPLRRDVTAHMFAVFDGHTYRVEQVQFSFDESGLPVTRLSLMRVEVNYDIAGI